MLEESLIQQQQAGGVGRGLAAPSSVGSGSTAETKPCSALLCPGLTASPAESPESTFEKRRSVASLGQHSSSKSSGNLTTSTHSSGGPRAPTPREAHLQQHQQPLAPPAPSAPPRRPCRLFSASRSSCSSAGAGAGGATRPAAARPHPARRTRVAALRVSPLSPLSDGPGGGRHLPAGAILEDDYTVPLQHSAVRPPRPSAPPVSITPEVSSCGFARQTFGLRDALGRGGKIPGFLSWETCVRGILSSVSKPLRIASLPRLSSAAGSASCGLPRRKFPFLSSLHERSEIRLWLISVVEAAASSAVVEAERRRARAGRHPRHGRERAGRGRRRLARSSGFTFTQDQHMRIILGTRSPEPRPRRNGIVTNPSLKAAHAKAAHLLRNGLSGRLDSHQRGPTACRSRRKRRYDRKLRLLAGSTSAQGLQPVTHGCGVDGSLTHAHARSTPSLKDEDGMQ
ncbi:hypothetical protein C7M84_001911 [Penaeus vannamei]|uniref:Uncharacterized protein n=1 Tax=Penaeus vannamei TaxID=6689 RepID=A0A3R7N7K5_PENVA|nr:hypothetical protein C7M84_001911 [Penaeus vannamei]